MNYNEIHSPKSFCNVCSSKQTDPSSLRTITTELSVFCSELSVINELDIL